MQDEESARDILGRESGVCWHAGDVMVVESSVSVPWVTWALEMRMGEERWRRRWMGQAKLSTQCWWQW